MAAIFVALDELLPYVPAANQDSTSYLACAHRNHAEAINKAFRFRLAFMRRLNEVKRVHSDQGVLDVLRAQHIQPAAEHLGSAIFGYLMKDATAASPAVQKLPLLLGWRRRPHDADVDVGAAAVKGVAAKVSTGDGVGLLSSELPAQCEVTYFR
eukprot:jgi/Tetstr1/459897/TSEL_005239.t1